MVHRRIPFHVDGLIHMYLAVFSQQDLIAMHMPIAGKTMLELLSLLMSHVKSFSRSKGG